MGRVGQFYPISRLNRAGRMSGERRDDGRPATLGQIRSRSPVSCLSMCSVPRGAEAERSAVVSRADGRPVSFGSLVPPSWGRKRASLRSVRSLRHGTVRRCPVASSSVRAQGGGVKALVTGRPGRLRSVTGCDVALQ
jgi:hypothetical protein